MVRDFIKDFLELRKREITIEQTVSDTFSQVLDEFRRIRVALEAGRRDAAAMKQIASELKASGDKLVETIHKVQQV